METVSTNQFYNSYGLILFGLVLTPKTHLSIWEEWKQWSQIGFRNSTALEVGKSNKLPFASHSQLDLREQYVHWQKR